MKQIRWALLVCWGLILISLELVFVNQEVFSLAELTLMLTAVWVLAVWRSSHWYNLSFLGLVGLSIYAVFLPFPVFFSLAALTLCLAAWDLSEFYILLNHYDPQPDAESLARPHIMRLSLVASIGFLLGSLALLLKFRLGFEAAVLLGLLVFLGIAQAIRYLRGLTS